MGRFTQLFPRPKPLIGVIHLPPLPGYAASPGLERVIEKALEDLRALEAGGADGALAENEEDRPHQVEAAPETIAAMTRVSRELVLAARPPGIAGTNLVEDHLRHNQIEVGTTHLPPPMCHLLMTRHHDVPARAARQVAHHRRLHVQTSLHSPMISYAFGAAYSSPANAQHQRRRAAPSAACRCWAALGHRTEHSLLAYCSSPLRSGTAARRCLP
jgi:hypothetical protein